MKTSTSIIIILVLLGSGYFLLRDKPKNTTSVPLNYDPAPVENVSMVDGEQIIEIRAKGGYLPRNSIAKAGVPTVLRFDSRGTFDCSASVRIPSMKINKSLDFSGSTDIPLGTQKPGILKGTCSMGMYSFKINFQN